MDNWYKYTCNGQLGTCNGLVMYMELVINECTSTHTLIAEVVYIHVKADIACPFSRC